MSFTTSSSISTTTSTAISTTEGRLSNEAELAIIFSLIAIVLVLVLGALLCYIRQSSKRQFEDAQRNLEKERDRVRFEKHKERREMVKTSCHNPDVAITKSAEVFTISPGHDAQKNCAHTVTGNAVKTGDIAISYAPSHELFTTGDVPYPTHARTEQTFDNYVFTVGDEDT